MKKLARFGRWALVGLCAAILPSSLPIAADAPWTVGRFVRDLARAAHLQAPDAGSAVRALRATGIHLPDPLELDRPLTQGAVVDVARGFGLRLTTSRPEAAFGAADVDRFLAAFGPQITGQSQRGGDEDDDDDEDDGPPFDPHSKGKGKGKPPDETPIAP